MDKDKSAIEQEAFEAWARREKGWSGSLIKGSNGKYLWGKTYSAWDSWQARASLSVPVNADAMKLLDSIITDMECGFVKCENCGEQEDTATLDFMPQLRELRAALSKSET